MFKSLFADDTPALKPMQHKHIQRAVDIIAQTDEDDAEDAQAAYQSGDLNGKFVFQRNGQVIGVTGFSADETAGDVAWLSWTYLDPKFSGEGFGSRMFGELLKHLDTSGFRKLFIETSDYEENGELIYASAHRMYEQFGAAVEVNVPDYHAPGEAKIIYGLENSQRPALELDQPLPDKGILITGLQADPECESVLGLTWEEAERPGVARLSEAVAEARANQARITVLILPSDLCEANKADISSAGFNACGTLPDFYARGLDQVWWVRNLSVA